MGFTNMNYFANKGMYIEELIEKSINYYLFNNICFIEKRYLPIKIIKRSGNVIEGKLLNKSYVDYAGLINGRYISFEAKQTENDKFMLSQIKEHQLNHLNLISRLNGISFLILHFYCEDKTFLIPYSQIENWITKQKIKSVDLNFLMKEKESKNVFILEVCFPGILNIYETVKQIIN
ncbi:Holliday junction resolvase RecU [Malacoplasma penetrans]|nr:Holliday junction resolvase RecU [Malacoplasma penetrans]